MNLQQYQDELTIMNPVPFLSQLKAIILIHCCFCSSHGTIQIRMHRDNMAPSQKSIKFHFISPNFSFQQYSSIWVSNICLKYFMQISQALLMLTLARSQLSSSVDFFFLDFTTVTDLSHTYINLQFVLVQLLQNI